MNQLVDITKKSLDNDSDNEAKTSKKTPKQALKTWIKGKHRGIRYREHPTRKVKGHLDRYYQIRYQRDGNTIEEAIGWESDGWTDDKANGILVEIKENIRRGEGHRSLKEKRENEVARLEAERERKRQEAVEYQTFDYFWITTYFPQIKQDRRSKKTINREKSLYERYIKPVIGSKSFKEINPIHIQRFKSNMDSGNNISGRRCAPRSIQYALSVVRQVFNSAHNHKIFMGDSPTKGVKFPTFDNRRMRFLTKDEAERLLIALRVRSERTYQIALTSLYTGMRLGEIAALRKGDIDLQNDRILVKDPKNKVTRYADITTQRLKDMLTEKKKGLPDELLFEDRYGGKIKKIMDTFSKVVKDLGLNDGRTDRRDKVVFHSLRHTHASWLSNAGTPINLVAEALGQKTLAMAARYSHTSEETRKNKARIMEAMDSEAAQAGSNVVSINSIKEGV